MIDTGIFIRAQIEGRWQSLDIGDPRLTAEQLLRWLVELSPSQLVRTFDLVREKIQ